MLLRKEIKYLAEMMNWPGVLGGDPHVYSKINIARTVGKVVDGHAPGLTGDQAREYVSAGISTDHECVSAEEALDKLNYGMHVIIREGSAARNFEALVDLLQEHADHMMFCSDDKHPDSLEEGHINLLVRRAVHRGIEVFKVLQAACINPISHYGLEVGLLRVGDTADFIVVDNLTSFNVIQTYLQGILVAERGQTMIGRVKAAIINNFSALPIQTNDLGVSHEAGNIRVMEAIDGQLITREILLEPKVVRGFVESDIERDVLKIAVVNRYTQATPAVAFIRGFGLQRGAIASSVAHDSHNIIAVGADDDSIARAINMIILEKGGISAVSGDAENILPLPVAGIMSAEDGYAVAHRYKEMDQMAKGMGSTLSAPYMTLSFMALLVIPSLKLSDKGLFDGGKFTFAPLFT